jgi:type IV pilus assembly protein PilZ
MTPPSDRRDRPGASPAERRLNPRVDVAWNVDCSDGQTFLYASITNISAMGIFIASRTPPAVGTALTLHFVPPGGGPFELCGEVAWVNPWREHGDNPNPGFGVRFTELSSDMRERLVALVHAIAYLPGV